MRNLHWFLLLAGFALNTGVSAQPELDPTFGNAGKTIANTIRSTANTDDIAIQADNKIILVSECQSIDLGTIPFCAVRLNDDGSTDTTFRGGSPFGSNGVFTRFGSSLTGGARGVVIQPDGKVVVAGFGPGEDVALVRYNSDGSLDPTFGSGGIILTDVTPGSNDRAEKVAIQPDGKLVIVGSTANVQFVARYLPDGTLDNSFGAGGIARTVITGESTQGRSIALQSDGKIVAGGFGVSGSYLLTRFNSDGSPDATWDGDGIRTIPIDPSGRSNSLFAGFGIRSVAIQPDGRVVAVGHKNIVFRFNADGSPDTSFDGDGSRPALNGPDKETYSLTLTAGGRIIVAGAAIASNPNPFPNPTIHPPFLFYTARYNPDGTPDTTFSDDGYLDIDFHDGYAATALAVDPIGRVVVAGFAALQPTFFAPWLGPVFSAARLKGPPVAVAVSGRVTDANGQAIRNATVKTDAGGTIIAARTNAFGYYNLFGVLTGQTYMVSVSAKGNRFTSRDVFVANQFVTVDFIAQGQSGLSK